MDDPTVPSCLPGVVGQSLRIDVEPSANWANVTLVFEKRAYFPHVSPCLAIGLVVGRMNRIGAHTDIKRVAHDLAIWSEQLACVLEESIHACQSLDHPDAVHHQQQRVKGVQSIASQIEDVDAFDVAHTARAHNLDGVGRDVDSHNLKALVLEGQAVASCARSHVKHVTLAQRQGGLLKWGKVRRLAEENVHRHFGNIAVIATNRDRRAPVSIEGIV